MKVEDDMIQRLNYRKIYYKFNFLKFTPKTLNFNCEESYRNMSMIRFVNCN